MKFDNHSEIVYQIYNYLKINCVGYENRKKSTEIINCFNISGNKRFRAIIEEIRTSNRLQKIVCSEAGKKGGYWIATSPEEAIDTYKDLMKRGKQMIITAMKIKYKTMLNNQFRIQFKNEKKINRKYYKKRKLNEIN